MSSDNLNPVAHSRDIQSPVISYSNKSTGQQIRSKIDSFQNANFLISQPNPMILPLIGIVSERQFQ